MERLKRTLAQEYKEFEETQDAIEKGVQTEDLFEYLKMTPEEKEAYLLQHYFETTGKIRL